MLKCRDVSRPVFDDLSFLLDVFGLCFETVRDAWRSDVHRCRKYKQFLFKQAWICWIACPHSLLHLVYLLILQGCKSLALAMRPNFLALALALSLWPWPCPWMLWPWHKIQGHPLLFKIWYYRSYYVFFNVLHTVFLLNNYHRHHYYFIAVFLENSENDSKLTD